LGPGIGCSQTSLSAAAPGAGASIAMASPTVGAGSACCGGRSATVDELVVATGLRPDLDFLREIRLSLDPALECPPELAPLIDPNEHSCGTVRPHGARELAQPEAGFYFAGMKSYGRAPTFLMLTGYEQVRSIAAEIAGDHEAAARVELVLPETGVCSGPGPAVTLTEAETAAGCCGGPAGPAFWDDPKEFCPPEHAPSRGAPRMRPTTVRRVVPGSRGSEDPGLRLNGPTIVPLLLTDRRRPGLQPSGTKPPEPLLNPMPDSAHCREIVN